MSSLVYSVSTALIYGLSLCVENTLTREKNWKFFPRLCDILFNNTLRTGCSNPSFLREDIVCRAKEDRVTMSNRFSRERLMHIRNYQMSTCKEWSHVISTGAHGLKCVQDIQCYPGYRYVPSVTMCVKFVTTAKNYSAATADCKTKPGGRVVHLNTDAKITAITAIIRNEYTVNEFYIGLNDEPIYRRGDFHWSDGTRLTDSNWRAENPDNNPHDDCVAMPRKQNYTWVDLYCSDLLAYICEIA